MRNNTKDKTLERSFLQKFRFLIKEYELVKRHQHPAYRFCEQLYQAHQTNRQTFMKYYNRFKQSGQDDALLPQKRGPKWKTRRPIPFIENKVVELRLKGNNRYEIVDILKPKLKQYCPSPTGVYNISKRYGLNKLTPKMKQSRKSIIKAKAGELGHVDAHYLPKGIIKDDNQRYYLVGLVDDCTRITWVEVIKDIKSLTVMFAILKSLNFFQHKYNIQFKEILSDNGPEFGRKMDKNKETHPFERMLIELDIKHRYTRPYRPQTNGKIERFWKTIEDDLLGDMCFDSLDELQDELVQYLYYYNHERPHQGINNQAPAKYNEILSTN